MSLESVSLSHFRSYSRRAFTFSPETTFIVGENTAGKSNLIEALSFLATGKSFRAEKELHVVQFGSEIARVKGKLKDEEADTLETVFALLPLTNSERTFQKRYLVNDVPRRRMDFAGILPMVLFTPEDLDLIIASPSIRRNFLDTVLEQVDREYRLALSSYTKALRHRNALLELARETGQRSEEQFAYWDDLLIRNGQLLTQRREAFIASLNSGEKDIMPLQVVYDRSVVSPERLLQYKGAEIGAGVTLVGPHRDDFSVRIPLNGQEQDVKLYGSRGQQRLVVLQLKLLQLQFMEKTLGKRPLLVLDDIFSELDAGHIERILSEVTKQQTIITTTHEEFITSVKGKTNVVIQLEKV